MTAMTLNCFCNMNTAKLAHKRDVTAKVLRSKNKNNEQNYILLWMVIIIA